MNLKTAKSYNHWYIWLAIVLAVAASLGFSWLVAAAGALQPNLVNLLIQIIIVAIIGSLLLLVIRRFKRTRSNLELARQNTEAEASLLRKRSAFIATASQTLSDKLGRFEQLAKQIPDDASHTKPLKQSTAKLRHLLNRLETISRLEANMVLTSKQSVVINDVVKTVLERQQAALKAKNITLAVQGDVRTSVVADATTVEQILDSIIDNAIKFSAANGGTIDIRWHRRGRHVEVICTDNGVGIEATKIPQLFKPFSRADGVMAFNNEGQGLSLYIDKLCVEMMGGGIDLQSSVGKGTTITLSFIAA